MYSDMGSETLGFKSCVFNGNHENIYGVRHPPDEQMMRTNRAGARAALAAAALAGVAAVCLRLRQR